jgi:hypothetical protein
MIRNRFSYWSSSKFSDWIRGEKKPFALEWGEWDKYYDDLKKRKPWRYWITEHLLKSLQNIAYYPYDIYNEICHYIRNRWVDKTHYLKTGLKPGRYHEMDSRILHGLFNELVDFVEVDLAHLSLWDRTKKYTFKNGRSIEAAYAYFDWVTNLKYNEDYGYSKDSPDYGTLTEQAKSYTKVKELYEWWKNERPNRVDPFDIFTKEAHGNKYFKLIDEREKLYEQEDTNKLIELIKIRGSLWT